MDRPSRVYLWKLFLCQEDAPVRSLDVQLDLFNQRVVHSDVERTRNPNMSLSEKELAETLLTLYCKTEGVSYKQGMNEVLAPFIFLGRFELSALVVYQMFHKFIKTYLGTTYTDEVRASVGVPTAAGAVARISSARAVSRPSVQRLSLQ